jgi:hypothetical protein
MWLYVYHTYFLLLARGNVLLYILLLVMALETWSSFKKKKKPWSHRWQWIIITSYEQEKDAGITSTAHTAVGTFLQLLFVNTKNKNAWHITSLECTAFLSLKEHKSMEKKYFKKKKKKKII